jgi:hypothetical protein
LAIASSTRKLKVAASTPDIVELQDFFDWCSEIEALLGSLVDVISSSESLEPYEYEDIVVIDERDETYE